MWKRFWFSEYDPMATALFRISLGTLLMVLFAWSAPNWHRFYALDGILSRSDPHFSQLVPDWNACEWIDGVLPLDALWGLGMAASVCFTIGLQTRLCTVVIYVLVSSMVHRTRQVTNGEDLVFRMLLFHSCFASLGRELSVDAWWRRRRHRPELPAPLIWPVRMMQINVALIYLISWPNKLLDDPAWMNGQAIYYTMASNMWSREWDPWLVYRWGGLFSKLATWGTLLIEGAFPLLVWFPRTRSFVLVPIALLHLGIAVVIPNVTLFTLAMVAAFWIYVPGEAVRAVLFKRRADSPDRS